MNEVAWYDGECDGGDGSWSNRRATSDHLGNLLGYDKEQYIQEVGHCMEIEDKILSTTVHD